jgi:hypothetical protein
MIPFIFCKSVPYHAEAVICSYVFFVSCSQQCAVAGSSATSHLTSPRRCTVVRNVLVLNGLLTTTQSWSLSLVCLSFLARPHGRTYQRTYRASRGPRERKSWSSRASGHSRNSRYLKKRPDQHVYCSPLDNTGCTLSIVDGSLSRRRFHLLEKRTSHTQRVLASSVSIENLCWELRERGVLKEAFWNKAFCFT